MTAMTLAILALMGTRVVRKIEFQENLRAEKYHEIFQQRRLSRSTMRIPVPRPQQSLQKTNDIVSPDV